MSANIEYQLICKVIETQDFHTVVKMRVTEDLFLGDQNQVSQTREAFRFIRDHFHHEYTHGSVPSWQLLQQRFAGFPWVASYDTLPTLCEELHRARLRAQIMTLTDSLNTKADVDPRLALNELKEAAAVLSRTHEFSQDMYLAHSFEQLYQEYQIIANGHGIVGIPWPWDILNEDTQGIHKSQFIVFYGRPKSMKSWLALYVVCCAYLKGYRTLVYSLEMPPVMVLRRCAAIIAQVDYEKFKGAKLDPATMQRVFGILQHLHTDELNRATLAASGHQPAILVAQPNGDSSGVSTLQAKIRDFGPDLVVVDGMYLMKDDRQKARNIDWKSITHISQDLKATARQFDIPVIGVTQANRGASKDPRQADLAELAYADAIAQDCDLCMRVHKQEDKVSHETEIILTFPGARESKLDGFVIHGVPATNFNFKRAQLTDPNAPSPQPTGNSGKSFNNPAPRGPVVLPNWRNP